MVSLERQIENKISELGEKNLDSKKIVLFGAGVYSKLLYKLLIKNHYTVLAVIDNNKSLEGHLFEEIIIQNADTFLGKFCNDNIFLILSRFYPEMKNQLERCGYKVNKHIFQMAEIDMIDDWHIVDKGKVDQCILSIIRGKEIYEQLTDTYGMNTSFLVNPVASIGDIYLMSFYIKEYLKNNPNSIFVFGSGTLTKLASQLCFGTIILLKPEQVQALLDFARVFGFERINIKLLHTGYVHFRIWSRMLTYVGITWMEHYRELFELPQNSEITVEKLHSDIQINQIFKTNQLIPGKTVVLSPYANTMRQFKEEFWSTLAENLLSLGFCVCTNVGTSRECAVLNTVPVYVEIENINDFVESAGYFIGIRSGLCDVICSCDCMKIILYSDEIFDLISVYDFYSIQKMGFGKNLLEFIVGNYNEEIILKRIINSMKGEMNSKNDRKLVFQNMIQHDKKLWFWDCNYNGLFCCNNNEKYAVQVQLNHKMDIFSGSLYGKIVFYDNKIIGIPEMADDILIYDMKYKSDRYVKLPDICCNKSELKKFRESVIDENFLFMLGFEIPIILKFDMQSEKIVNFIDVFTGNRKEKNRKFFVSGIIKGKKILVPDYSENIVYEADIYTMHLKKIAVKLISESNTIIKIDKGKDEICILPLKYEQVIIWNRNIKNKKFYLFPFRLQNDEVLIFDSLKNEFTIIKYSLKKTFENYYMENKARDRFFELFFYSQKCNDFFYVFDEKRELLEFTPKDGISKKKSFYITWSDYQRYRGLEISTDKTLNNVFYENNFYSITGFLSCLKEMHSMQSIKENKRISIGNSIFEKLK